MTRAEIVLVASYGMAWDPIQLLKWLMPEGYELVATDSDHPRYVMVTRTTRPVEDR